MSSRALDLAGQRFGRLTAVRSVSLQTTTGPRVIHWHCVCDCGSTRLVTIGALRSGHTQSCGCAHVKHGAHKRGQRTPEYSAWGAMIQRCTNPNSLDYHNYGGRGITVAARWRSFPAFLADMGYRPEPSLTLERIDNNAGYGPDNCKWATRSEQQFNTRRSRHNDTQDSASASASDRQSGRRNAQSLAGA